jgi:mitochondrial fission protein ELM1
MRSNPAQTTEDAASPRRTCWVISGGRAGLENQCLGLAEALARRRPVAITMRRVALRWPWQWMTEAMLAALKPGPRVLGGDALAPPWPDLVIAGGRAGVAAALAVKRLSGGATRIVAVQHPRIDPRHFDLVIPPEHDGLRGDNVLPILGAPNRVTREKIEEAGRAFEPQIAHLPRPRVAVLIGGDSKAYRLTPARARRIADELRALAEGGAGLMVTPSRRTGAANIATLRAALADTGCFFWDGEGENPYFGMLGCADHVLATEESTNLITDAAATGKPVHLIALEGGNKKFRLFHEILAARGIARPFTGSLEEWTYTPLDETARAAARVDEMLG